MITLKKISILVLVPCMVCRGAEQPVSGSFKTPQPAFQQVTSAPAAPAVAAPQPVSYTLAPALPQQQQPAQIYQAPVQQTTQLPPQAPQKVQAQLPLQPVAQAPSAAFAPPASPFKCRFTGGVRYDAFWDSRQVVGFREDSSFLLPTPEFLDSCNRDVTAAPQFTMLAIRTNFGWEVDGPPVFKSAASRLVIKGDFSGPWAIDNVTDTRPPLSLSVINGLQLSDGYFVIDWPCHSVLIGQHWHPLYDPRWSESYLMIEPIARSPQIRVTKKVGCFELLAAAIGQVDFTNDGPNLFAESLYEPRFVEHQRRFNPDFVLPDRTPNYLRNSLVPNLNFQVRSFWKKHIAGLALDIKVLKPRLFTTLPDLTGLKAFNAGGNPAVLIFDGTGTVVPDDVFFNLATVRPKVTKATETFTAASVMAFAAFDWECYTLKLKGFYGQSMSDCYMLGGYGVVNKDGLRITSVAEQGLTGKEEYSPVCSAAFMSSLLYKYSPKLQLLLGGGYAKNLGLRGDKKLVKVRDILNPARPNIQYDVFHFKPDMDYLGKLNFTARFLHLPVVFAAGLEYNRAGYGEITDEAKIINNNNVNHVRVFFTALYNF